MTGRGKGRGSGVAPQAPTGRYFNEDWIMFIGPVFAREATIAPRRDKTYVGRGVYGGFLLLVVSAAWLVTSGSQRIVDVGDFARFGSSLFGLLAPLQLVVTLFFGATLAAAAVGQEKDRKTLLLLLLTRLTNSELVLGKLCAALLSILVFIVVSVPILLATALLGGVSLGQVGRVFCVTLFATLASGSLGSAVALWRDKTFQALSATILLLTIWIGFWEAVGFGILGDSWFGYSTEAIACAMSPWRAILVAARPDDLGAATGFLSALHNSLAPVAPFLVACAALTAVINAVAILMVRVWNPSRETIKNATMEQDTWRQEAIQARLDREAAERRSQISGTRDDNPYADLTDNLFAVEETLHDVETREGTAGVAAVAREVLSQKSGLVTEESIAAGVAPEGKYAIDPSVSSSGKRKKSGTIRFFGASSVRARTAVRRSSFESPTYSCSFSRRSRCIIRSRRSPRRPSRSSPPRRSRSFSCPCSCSTRRRSRR
ncbi:MAG: ABC transporter permease subunit [Thermoguttaceae bacterium]|nr:ABC transporter permease subunit [Thermoguttaceae bacterium]